MTTDFRCNDKGSLRVSLRELPHGLALPDSEVTNFLVVEIEEMKEYLVLFEMMKFVDAEPVHVVIDLDNSFALRAPVAFYFLPKGTAIELFRFGRLSAIRNSKVRLIDFEHVLRINECSKHKTYRVNRQPFVLKCFSDPCLF